MKNCVYYFLFLFLLNCESVSKSMLFSDCGNTFQVQYDKAGKYLLPKNEINKDYFLFYFENDFNEKIKITINQKEIYNKEVKTNEKKSDEYSDKFIYNIDPKEKKIILRGYSEKNNTCFELPLNKKYRIIYLYYYQNQWIIRFSNNLRII